jgi:hypothetical protein
MIWDWSQRCSGRQKSSPADAIPVSLSIEGKLDNLPEALRLCLYRSIPEAINPVRGQSRKFPASRLRERLDATETPDVSSRPQPAPPALHSSWRQREFNNPPLLRYRPMHSPCVRLHDNRFQPKFGTCPEGLSGRLRKSSEANRWIR